MTKGDKCDKCSARAVYFQKYSGSCLCMEHFDADLQRKVKETIRETGLFGRGVRIAVALDGGKDSVVLAFVLRRLFMNRPDIEMVAVTVDQGIECRIRALEHSKAAAEKMRLEQIVLSFGDSYGITIDEIARGGEDRGDENQSDEKRGDENREEGNRSEEKSICAVCSGMRMKLLQKAAKDLDADVLATGQNLDDLAEAVMGCYLRGEPAGLPGASPGPAQFERESVPVIRPLIRVPESEVALYATIHDLLPENLEACPYREKMRTEIGLALDEFESGHPGTKYSLYRSMERMIDLLPEGLRDGAGQSL